MNIPITESYHFSCMYAQVNGHFIHNLHVEKNGFNPEKQAKETSGRLPFSSCSTFFNLSRKTLIVILIRYQGY